jgi:cell division protein FtsL
LKKKTRVPENNFNNKQKYKNKKQQKETPLSENQKKDLTKPEKSFIINN